MYVLGCALRACDDALREYAVEAEAVGQALFAVNTRTHMGELLKVDDAAHFVYHLLQILTHTCTNMATRTRLHFSWSCRCKVVDIGMWTLLLHTPSRKYQHTLHGPWRQHGGIFTFIAI